MCGIDLSSLLSSSGNTLADSKLLWVAENHMLEHVNTRVSMCYS